METTKTANVRIKIEERDHHTSIEPGHDHEIEYTSIKSEPVDDNDDGTDAERERSHTLSPKAEDEDYHNDQQATNKNSKHDRSKRSSSSQEGGYNDTLSINKTENHPVPPKEESSSTHQQQRGSEPSRVTDHTSAVKQEHAVESTLPNTETSPQTFDNDNDSGGGGGGGRNGEGTKRRRSEVYEEDGETVKRRIVISGRRNRNGELAGLPMIM